MAAKIQFYGHVVLAVDLGNKYIFLTNVENEKISNMKMKLLKNNKAITTHPELILFSIRGLAVSSVSITNKIPSISICNTVYR